MLRPGGGFATTLECIRKSPIAADVGFGVRSNAAFSALTRTPRARPPATPRPVLFGKRAF